VSRQAARAKPENHDATAVRRWRFTGDDKKYQLYLKKALNIDPQNELALDIESGRCKFICK
jgi:hypothetical protein